MGPHVKILHPLTRAFFARRRERAAPVVQLRKVSKRVGRTMVLDRVSATFREGELTLILGEAQSGKSVLARIVSGQNLPDSGHIARRCEAAPLVGAAWGFASSGTVLRGLELRASSYGISYESYVDAVAELMPDPEVLRHPLERLSAIERAILLYGSSYLIPSDHYVVENAPLPTEERAQSALMRLYETVRARAAIIWLSRGDAHAKSFPPDRVLTLGGGKLALAADVTAIESASRQIKFAG